MAQWLQSLQALVGLQNPLVAAVIMQNPWACLGTMTPSLADQVIICLTRGLDMADTHPLHQWDREQGTAMLIAIREL